VLHEGVLPSAAWSGLAPESWTGVMRLVPA
jgi:hypothetical protein